MADLIQQQNPPKTADRTIDRFKSRIVWWYCSDLICLRLFLLSLMDVVDPSVNDLESKVQIPGKGCGSARIHCYGAINIPFRGSQSQDCW